MHVLKEVTTHSPFGFCYFLDYKKILFFLLNLFRDIGNALLSVIGQGLLSHGQLMMLACNQMLKRTDGLTKSDLVFYLSLCCPLIMQVLNTYAIQLEEQDNV